MDHNTNLCFQTSDIWKKHVIKPIYCRLDWLHSAKELQDIYSAPVEGKIETSQISTTQKDCPMVYLNLGEDDPKLEHQKIKHNIVPDLHEELLEHH